ncbi:MAG: hypothetical protein ACKPEN_17525 [Planktothrix sp.]|uniref:hypothetical protein n=1 Tax=Planktothrix sp. TaxID=3088171 RepID=UPI0038D3C56B
MPIPVNFFNLTKTVGGVNKTYAFKPEDISFGDDETLEVKLNQGGDIAVIPLVKKSVTLTLNGAVDVDLDTFENERVQNVQDLIDNQPVGANMSFSNYIIYNAYLRKVTPTAPITVSGKTLFDTIELEYVSRAYV